MTTKRSQKRQPSAKPPVRGIMRFLVTLEGTDPLVWRRIEVPADYSFWDLHVATQDAMGWKDSHLHEFRVFHPTRKKQEVIGMPVDGYPDRYTQQGWKEKIADYFDLETELGMLPSHYVYDFGDDWRHTVTCERISARMPREKYPICISGERACPPENCGGVAGFADLLVALAHPDHPDHDETVEWLGSSYDPNVFLPDRVTFADPRRRWSRAFQ